MSYKDYDWRTGRYCVYKNFYHLVFVTKYRRGVFTKEMLNRLNDVFKETCFQIDCELHEFNGENDHVHMLISAPPKLSIAILVGKLQPPAEAGGIRAERRIEPTLRTKMNVGQEI